MALLTPGSSSRESGLSRETSGSLHSIPHHLSAHDVSSSTSVDDSVLPAATPLSQRWASQGLDPQSSLANAGRAGSHPDLSSTATTPSAASDPVAAPPITRGIGGSLRSLARSIQGLFGSRSLDEPRSVKGLFNMSTTSTKSPPDVRAEIVRVLQERGIDFKERGFVLKARFVDAATGRETIVINMEVCRVHRMDLTGIKLTRLKGDTWAYKRACQDIVSALHL